MIQGRVNYLKLYNYKLLNLHKKKQLHFLFGLSNSKKPLDHWHKINRDLKLLSGKMNEEYEKLLSSRKHLTERETKVIELIKVKSSILDIAKELDIRKSSASRILNSIYRKGGIGKINSKEELIWRKTNHVS